MEAFCFWSYDSKTKQAVKYEDLIAGFCEAVLEFLEATHLCLCGQDGECISWHIGVGLSAVLLFIEVIHAGVIEGNHFTAKLYCNYGDEKLLFSDTNTE